MARTTAGKLLTEAHRRSQLGLRALVMQDVIRLYPSWRLREPATYQRLEDLLVTLAQLRAGQSAIISAAYYEAFRAADAPGALVARSVPAAAPPTEDMIRASVSATSRAAVWRALGAGQSYEQAMANGLVELSGAVARLAMKGGRDTIQDEVVRDAKALGWARVTDEAPCAFCAMLAGRGPVYKEKTAGFRSHGHCGCTAEAHYEGSEWPGRGRQFEALWQQTGSLNTFRQALNKKPAAAAMAAATT